MKVRHNIEKMLEAISFDGETSVLDKIELVKDSEVKVSKLEVVELPDFLEERGYEIDDENIGPSYGVFIVSRKNKGFAIGIGEEQKHPGSEEKKIIVEINHPDDSISRQEWRRIRNYILRKGFKEYQEGRK